jgi:hypothetical protein
MELRLRAGWIQPKKKNVVILQQLLQHINPRYRMLALFEKSARFRSFPNAAACKGMTPDGFRIESENAPRTTIAVSTSDAKALQCFSGLSTIRSRKNRFGSLGVPLGRLSDRANSSKSSKDIPFRSIALQN